MRWWRGFWPVASLALLGAVVGAGSRVAVETVEQRAEWAVPVGLDGDLVEYAGSERNGSAPAETLGWAMRFQGLSESLDVTGALRRTVRVAMQWTGEEEPSALYHVALDDRAAVRWDHASSRASGQEPATPIRAVATEFGPGMKGWFIAHPERLVGNAPSSHRLDLGLLAFQDHAFRQDEPLPAAVEASLWLEAGLAQPGMRADAHGVAVGVGRVGSAEAQVLRWSGTFVWNEPADTPELSTTTLAIGWTAEAGASYAFTREFWVSRDSPYPLAIRDVLEGPGKAQRTREFVGVSEQREGSPILWLEPGAGVLSPPSPLLPPGRPGGLPPDGGTSMCFTHEEALEALSTSGEGVGYAKWRSEHPDGVPVLTVGVCRIEPGGWGFQFWSPQGSRCPVFVQDGVQRKTENQYLQTLANNQQQCVDAPDDPNRQFDPTAMARPRVSMATAEAMWKRTTLTRPPDSRINFVETGHVAIPYTRVGPVAGSRVLLVGYRELVAEGPNPELDPNAFVTASYLFVNVETGRLLGALEDRGPLFQTAEQVGAKLAWLKELLLGPEGAASVQSQPVPAGPTDDTDVLAYGAIGSLSALLLAALVFFLPLLKFFATQAWVSSGGYARLHGDEVLRHGARQRVLAAIEQDPGATPPQLARALAMPWSTLVYHLVVLEKNGQVASRVEGRHKYFFPAGAASRLPALAVLRNAKSRTIFEILEAEPGLSRDDLATRLGFSVPAAVWHIERLERVGLLGRDRVGRRVRYYVVGRPAAQAPVDDVT